MKKNILFILTYLLFSLFARSQTTLPIKDYISKYKELAIMEEIRTGVPASITLAQALLESQAGVSDLCLRSNNHFGIKCKDEWTGKKVYHDDDAKGECFRRYASVEDSYRDHSDFLKNRPNYASLFYLEPTDYKGWAYGLKRAGYATNPVYAQSLIKYIEENNLHQYTLIALERRKIPHDNAVGASFVGTGASGSDGTTIQNAVQVSTGEYGPVKYPEGTFVINNARVIHATAGTSLFALATKSNISFKKLLEFNNLNDNEDILQQDKLIYLERKPKKSNAVDYHIVADSETLEDISAKEGVEVESLYEYNKVQKGMQPATGEKVYLKPGKPAYYPKLVKHVSDNAR